MLKFDHFIRSSKDHFMLAYNSTTAHCGNTDFLGVTLLSSLAAVIYIMILAIHSLIQAVCKGKGGSAWCIQFQLVVLLHDLHIKTSACQNFWQRPEEASEGY